MHARCQLRWEFIKENKKVRKQENTLSTKKSYQEIKKKRKKHALDEESNIQEKTITIKKDKGNKWKTQI